MSRFAAILLAIMAVAVLGQTTTTTTTTTLPPTTAPVGNTTTSTTTTTAGPTPCTAAIMNCSGNGAPTGNSSGTCTCVCNVSWSGTNCNVPTPTAFVQYTVSVGSNVTTILNTIATILKIDVTLVRIVSITIVNTGQPPLHRAGAGRRRGARVPEPR